MAETSAIPPHARARVRDFLRLPPDVIDEMADDAVGHAMRVLGLLRHGAPRPEEPLSEAIARVRELVGHGDDLSLRVAGLATVNEAGGPDALPALINGVPGWLSRYTRLDMDRAMLDLDIKDNHPDASQIKSAEDVPAGVRAWPYLPRGAANDEEV